jgi:hypothetical protein
MKRNPLKAAALAALSISALLACGTGVETGTGGKASTTSASAGGGTTAASSTGTGGPACDTDPDCLPGLSCCGKVCVNLRNDIFNCGSCGKTCGGDHPICNLNTCADAPCNTTNTCGEGGFCCNTACCTAGMLCCEVQAAGPSMGPACVAPEFGTCPVGCTQCK